MKTKNRFTEIQKPLEAVTTSLGRSIKSNQQELAAAIIGGSNKEASDYFESYYLNIQQITEHSLVRDLIYILQGIPSKFILLKNTQITTYKHLPRPTLALIEKIARLGQVYCDIKMKMNMKEGLFKQSLKEFISKELHKYYLQLSLLEQSMDKEDGSKNYTARTMTLKKLYVWHLQPLQKLTTILSILNQTEDIKGGEMLSVISKYKTHGNKAVSSFVDEMIKEITIPFNEMVKKWVYQGINY
jgi:gamma-tubulin complex component 3